MNHDEAIRTMAAERYLLNELSPEAREQFEEHFFDCAECASDLRAGAIFVEQSKVLLAPQSPVAQPLPVPKAEKSGWFAWLRPAIAVPALAVLLAVIAYQNWPSPRNPQILQAVAVNIGSRGSAPTISVKPNEGFLLKVSVPPVSLYSSYEAEIYSPDGKVQSLINLPLNPESDSYFIQVPPGRYQSGLYSVAILGTGAHSASAEVGRGNFELQILK